MQLVIDRLATLANDEVMKSKVELYDDKLYLMGTVEEALIRYPGDPYSWDDHVLWLTGLSMLWHDAVLLGWREKVLFDRVRPTTLIQAMGDTEITTWGGPFQGLKTIKARDWQPYIRVMPHAEFPSGSSCLCTAIQEYTDAFLDGELGISNSMPVAMFWSQGRNKVEPGTPSQDLLYFLPNMQAVAEECGQSRLWGGMHFTQSVPSGVELCSGLGTQAYNRMLLLKGGA